MNIEEQLRTYADEVGRVAIQRRSADVVEVVARAKDRRSLVIVGGVAAAVVLVLVTVLVINRSETTSSVVDAGPTDPTATSTPDDSSTIAPPPPEPDAPMSLWFSANRVPPGPVEVVMVLVNHGVVEATFGVSADLERWSGSEWEPFAQSSMCLDMWFCTAGFAPGNFSGAVNDIAIGAGLGRPGSVERFTLDGLVPGWYRVSQADNDGIVATGVIEIATDAVLPAPLAPVGGPAIALRPAVVPPRGGPVDLTPLIQGDTRTGELAAVVAGLAEEVAIERWQGGEWRSQGSAPLLPLTVAGPAARTAALPARLPAGEYRIVRAGPNGDHIGRFWVADLTTRQAMPAAQDVSLEPIDVAAVPVPTLTIDPAGPYRDGQAVMVRGVGFEPGIDVTSSIAMCEAGTEGTDRCTFATLDAPVAADADGRFTTPVVLRVETSPGVDCRETRGCLLAWIPPDRSTGSFVWLELEP